MSLTSQAPKSITAISASLIINIANIGIVAHKVEGFGEDDAFSFEDVDTIEKYIGVDGQLNAGYIPQLKSMSLLLAPTSGSLNIFNLWYAEMQKQDEVIWAESAIITIPAIKKSYVLTNGVLDRYTPVPAVKKVIQPIPAGITWSKVVMLNNG